MNDSAEKIATNLRKGVLEYCVLALLSGREMYGLELANELVELELTASEGSLYPLLARMKVSGSVDTRWDQVEGSRSRKYYAITSRGREQLSLFASVWDQLSDRVDSLLGGDHV